jgi:hypothetical protein
MAFFRLYHFSLKHNNSNNNNKLYSHILKSVREQQNMTVLWNQAIRTDGEVMANKPDIILKADKT